MKSFALATLFASANAVCSDYADCGTTVRCDIEIHTPQGTVDCRFPDFRKACCIFFQVSMDCHGEIGCIVKREREREFELPLDWMTEHGERPSESCPEIQYASGASHSSGMPLDRNMHQYCHMNGNYSLDEFAQTAVVDTVLEAQMDIMTAQQTDDPEVQSSWMPGVLGFAAGLAVATTAAVAFKKRKPSGEMYASLNEVTA